MDDRSVMLLFSPNNSSDLVLHSADSFFIKQTHSAGLIRNWVASSKRTFLLTYEVKELLFFIYRIESEGQQADRWVLFAWAGLL